MKSSCFWNVLEKLRRRTGEEGEMAKKERRIDANEYVWLSFIVNDFFLSYFIMGMEFALFVSFNT